MIQFKRLSPDATLPTRATDGSAGFDLYCTRRVDLPPGQRMLLPTGIAVALPPNTCGQIWPRSGMASRQGIDRLAGLVDADYRGEIHVSLVNHGMDVTAEGLHSKSDIAAELAHRDAEIERLSAERDALAAHVERLFEVWDTLTSEDRTDVPTLIQHVDDVFADGPTTSLARRDLIKQAEALEKLAENFAEAYAGRIRCEAAELRRQSEGGGHAKAPDA